MKTPAELINDLKSALAPMEDDADTIFDFSTMIGVLTAGPDAETAIDGINRLMIVIRDRAANLRRSHDMASQAVQRLANP
jgi:hypothetical protein